MSLPQDQVALLLSALIAQQTALFNTIATSSMTTMMCLSMMGEQSHAHGDRRLPSRATVEEEAEGEQVGEEDGERGAAERPMRKRKAWEGEQERVRETPQQWARRRAWLRRRMETRQAWSVGRAAMELAKAEAGQPASFHSGLSSSSSPGVPSGPVHPHSSSDEANSAAAAVVKSEGDDEPMASSKRRRA